jgi:hypothetical protein
VTAATSAIRREAPAIAAGLVATTLAVAVAVRIMWAADVRRALAFPFAGIPARLDEAASILANNARLLAAVFAAVLVAQSPWIGDPDARWGPVMRALLAAVDAVLALAVALNVALIGAALGAYGARMAAAMLPHGPLELAAYALALGVYVRARREPLSARHVLVVGGCCLGLLAIAALLETFAVP